MEQDAHSAWTRRRLIAGVAGVAALGALSYVQLPHRAAVPLPSLKRSHVLRDDFPLTIVDPTGVSVTLPRPPQRIVSATLATDEILSQLVDVERIASVSYLADEKGLSNALDHYPPQLVRNHELVEELISLEPDLVFMRDVSEAAKVRLLLSAGIPVMRFAYYDSFAEIDASVRSIGRVLGAEDRANAVLMNMWQHLEAVSLKVDRLKPPRVLWYSRLGGVQGEGTLDDECVERAGGANVIRETGIKGHGKLTTESAISLLPDTILVGQWPDGADVKQSLLDSPAWQDVPAVRNRRIHILDSAWATTGSPFRAKGVEQIARALHPEAFST